MINGLRIGLIIAVLAAVTLVMLPVQLVALALDLKLRRSLPRVWHRIACRLLGIRIRMHGRPDHRRPLMLVANHVSWKDILVLGAATDVVFIAKAEVADWPLFGRLAKLQKSIFVVREQKRRAGDQVNEIATRMAAGETVVLFPEGTTSDGNRLLEIKSSLFGAASSAAQNVPQGLVHVQPVALAYTGLHGMPMGRFHRPVAAWPGDIELVPHLKGILKVQAIEVDLMFGKTVDFAAGGNRKALSTAIAADLRYMLADRLRGRSGAGS